jgi:hypothetical protein
MRPLVWLCSLCIVLGGGCVGGVGCGSDTEQTAPAASASADAGEELAKGNDILAAVGKLSFREGKIVKIAGDTITFAHGRADPVSGKKAEQAVERKRVWLLGRSLEAKAGDALVCRVEPMLWLPCKVEERAATDYRVVDASGKALRLAATELVRPDDETVTALAKYLEREEALRAFDRAFEDAGAPSRPADWKPAKGDAVLVRFVGSSWYGATVLEVRRKKVRIEYDAKVFPDLEVEIDRVAPVASSEIAAGAYVLVRPRNKGGSWDHARVERIDGNAAELVTRSGDTRKAERDALVAMVK